jgi:hypothetical protein
LRYEEYVRYQDDARDMWKSERKENSGKIHTCSKGYLMISVSDESGREMNFHTISQKTRRQAVFQLNLFGLCCKSYGLEESENKDESVKGDEGRDLNGVC